LFLFVGKVRTAIKLEGGGGLGLNGTDIKKITSFFGAAKNSIQY